VGVQGKAGMDMYKEFEQDRDQGNFDKLPELHAVLSGMKVGSTEYPGVPSPSPRAHAAKSAEKALWRIAVHSKTPPYCWLGTPTTVDSHFFSGSTQ